MGLSAWIGFAALVLAAAAFGLQLVKVGRGAASPRSLVPEMLHDLGLVCLGILLVWDPTSTLRIVLIAVFFASFIAYFATRKWGKAPQPASGAA